MRKWVIFYVNDQIHQFRWNLIRIHRLYLLFHLHLIIRFFVPKRRKIFVVIVKYLKIGIILIGHYSSEWDHEYSGIILNHSPWPKSDLDNQNTPQDFVFVISSVDNEFSTFSKLRRKFMVLRLAFSAFKAC